LISRFKTKRNFGEVQLLVFLLLIQTSRYIQLFFAGYEFTVFSSNFSLLSFIVNTFLIFVCGVLLNNILNRYELFETKSQLGAATFFIFCAFIPYNQNIGLWLIPLILSLIIFNKVIKATRASRVGRNYFDSAILLGIIVIFFPAYIFYILPILVSMILFKKISFSSLFLVFIGLFFVTIFWTLYLFAIDNLEWYQQLILNLKQGFTLFQLDVMSFLQPMYFFSLSWIFTLIFWFSRKRKLNDTSLAILQYSSVLSLIGICTAFLFFGQQMELLLFTFFAFSVLFSYLLYHTKVTLANILFLILTGYAIAYPWIKHLNLDL